MEKYFLSQRLLTQRKTHKINAYRQPNFTTGSTAGTHSTNSRRGSVY